MRLILVSLLVSLPAYAGGGMSFGQVMQGLSNVQNNTARMADSLGGRGVYAAPAQEPVRQQWLVDPVMQQQVELQRQQVEAQKRESDALEEQARQERAKPIHWEAGQW